MTKDEFLLCLKILRNHVDNLSNLQTTYLLRILQLEVESAGSNSDQNFKISFCFYSLSLIPCCEEVILEPYLDHIDTILNKIRIYNKGNIHQNFLVEQRVQILDSTN